MKALFFSHIYSNSGFTEILLSKGKRLPGVAVSNYEKGFLSALELSKRYDIETINREFYPYCPSFNEQDNVQKFVNELDFCKHKNQDSYYYSLVKNDKDIVGKIKTAKYVFFSTYHDYRLFKFVKKINPSIVSLLILPDLPDFIINKSSILHTLNRKYHSSKFYKNLKFIDGLLPITEHMGIRLSKYVKNFTVVESVSKEEDIQAKRRDTYKKQIIYCGSLAKKYGVVDLINAFKKSKAVALGYKLVFCGKGECEEFIKQEASNNSNIIFEGFLPREKILDYLHESAFIVVPENPLNEYSKYSFHSKLIESLGSGTPVIAYYYLGMPSSYKDYILEISSDNLDVESSLVDALNKYLPMKKEENIAFGERARSFIKNATSPETTIDKIDELIGRIEK